MFPPDFVTSSSLAETALSAALQVVSAPFVNGVLNPVSYTHLTLPTNREV